MTAVDDTTGAPSPRERAVPQHEPGPTADDLVRRARDLREHLRAEQEATEKRTFYSQETHEAFERAGFYRMLQPRAFGGHELRVPDFYRVIVEIARGCPSTGWCLCLGAGHVVNLATMFGEDIQAEVFDQQGYFVAPFRIVPTVRAVPHEQGWQLDGVWGFSSGAPYSTHAMGVVVLPPGEDGLPRIGTALVPRSGYTVLDDWGNTIGLRGSGSHSVRLENTVVPGDHVIDVDPRDLTLDKTFGMAVHGNPMYTGRFTGFFWGELLAVAVGIGRAMFDEYRAGLLAKTPMWNPGLLRADEPHYQRWYGEARALLDAAEAVLTQVGETYHTLCENSVRGESEFDIAEDLRLGNLAQQGGRWVTEAMDLLARTGGTSALLQGTRAERYWRDFSTYRSHATPLMRDEQARMLGAADLEARRAGPGTGDENDDRTKAGAR